MRRANGARATTTRMAGLLVGSAPVLLPPGGAHAWCCPIGGAAVLQRWTRWMGADPQQG